MYFDSFDCASWVLRAFNEMAHVGAKFNPNIKLNYTRINLYTDTPIFLGNQSVIQRNATLMNNLTKFYSHFQKRATNLDIIEEILEDLVSVFINKEPFYFYFNSEYWLLPLKSPHVKFTYFVTPLPGGQVKYSGRDRYRMDVNGYRSSLKHKQRKKYLVH